MKIKKWIKKTPSYADGTLIHATQEDLFPLLSHDRSRPAGPFSSSARSGKVALSPSLLLYSMCSLILGFAARV